MDTLCNVGDMNDLQAQEIRELEKIAREFSEKYKDSPAEPDAFAAAISDDRVRKIAYRLSPGARMDSEVDRNIDALVKGVIHAYLIAAIELG